MPDELENEDVYSATRTEQLFYALERRQGYSRRELLKLGAVGLPLLAGIARLASPQRGAGRQRLADLEAASGAVVHELRLERRDALGLGRPGSGT